MHTWSASLIKAHLLQVGAFQVLVMGKNGNEASTCVDRAGPFCTFRDASSGPACFGLTVHSTIQVKCFAYPTLC